MLLINNAKKPNDLALVMYLPMCCKLKLQHRIGIDLGFLRPTFRFPDSPPLQSWMSSSPMSSAPLGSSRPNGSVDLTTRSITMLSDVPFVFIRCPVLCCPHMLRAQSIAVDFPKQ